MAAVAGCIGRENTDGDSTTDSATTATFDPATDFPYGEWLTTTDDDLLIAYADLDAVPTSIGSDASLEDPLITYSLRLNQAVVGLGQIQLSFAGLTSAVAPEMKSESTVSEVTVLDQTIVAEGTFATETLDKRLVEPTDETWGIAYERTDQVQGYDQYKPAEIPDSFNNDPPVVAVSSETVVAGPDTDRVYNVITGRNESDTGFFEGNETIAELFEVAGAGDLVVGEIGARRDSPLGVRETFDGEFSLRAARGRGHVSWHSSMNHG
ncbi:MULTISPECIES: hypothetical protein [Halobacterium]|nr:MULTISPECIES: hypothetical protein [Halobacterium]MCF2165489.1 hypothetical protein [Halobacterium salinarum]MDL0119642.1 hypothetical protein [Halobacterium salinarum]MDL0133680.1 hypothetical protein [Halobacterium salinarum]